MPDTHFPKTIRLVASRRSVAKPSATSLGNLSLRDWDNVDGDGIETEVLEKILGLAVDVQLASLREVEGRNLRNVLILALTLLLLKLEGDTTDGTTLNTLHQVGGVASNLVAQTLGSDDSDLVADALVGLEVESELGVVPLNDDLGGLLDGLGTDATHFGGIELVLVGCGCERVAREIPSKTQKLVLRVGVGSRCD